MSLFDSIKSGAQKAVQASQAAIEKAREIAGDMNLLDSVKSGAQKAIQASHDTLEKAKEIASESLSSEKIRKGKDFVADKLEQGRDFVVENIPGEEKIVSTFSRLRDSASSVIKRK